MSDKNIQIITKVLQNAHGMMNNRSWINDDIFEHLPTLYRYAKECTSVVEAGVRNCVSSYPLLKGLLENPSKQKKMVSIDLYKSEGMKAFEVLAKELINFSFFEGSDLVYPIQGMYDLVFIDSYHCFGQLSRELKMYAPHATKYIIMHDSSIDEWHSEVIRDGWDPIKMSKETGFSLTETLVGLWPAILEFLEENKNWRIKERFKNNNGLTVLERIDIPKPETQEIKETPTQKVLIAETREIIEVPNINRIEEVKETPNLESKEVPPTLQESKNNCSVKNIEAILKVMKDNNCKNICIYILGGFSVVFTEITSTLQRQIIDAGVICKILKGSEPTNPETLYLLFNAHQFSEPIPKDVKYAVFNYEQGGSSYIKYQHYLDKMKEGVAIFDYSNYNKEILEKLLGKTVTVVPFSYHYSLKVLELNTKNDEEIDVLFYGVMNSNRQLYADILKNTTYNVKFVTDYNLFGDSLYAQLSKSKIVLNLHYYTNPSVLELSRIVPLISNYKLVFSEASNDTTADARFSEMVEFITPENIVSKLDQYLGDPELRYQKVIKAFEILSSEV